MLKLKITILIIFFFSCMQAQEPLTNEMLQEKLKIIYPNYIQEHLSYLITGKIYTQKNIDSLIKTYNSLNYMYEITTFYHHGSLNAILNINKKKSKPLKTKNVIKFRKQLLNSVKAKIANVDLPILYINNILIPSSEVREKIKNINENEFLSRFYGYQFYMYEPSKLVAVWVKTL